MPLMGARCLVSALSWISFWSEGMSQRKHSKWKGWHQWAAASGFKQTSMQNNGSCHTSLLYIHFTYWLDPLFRNELQQLYGLSPLCPRVDGNHLMQIYLSPLYQYDQPAAYNLKTVQHIQFYIYSACSLRDLNRLLYVSVTLPVCLCPSSLPIRNTATGRKPTWGFGLNHLSSNMLAPTPLWLEKYRNSR